MWQKLQGNKSLNYFILYCITFTFYGATISAIGPVIPYLASLHSVPELTFTYLFTCRSVGFLVGAVLIKAITLTSIPHHSIAAAACLLGGVTFVMMPFTHSFTAYGLEFFVNSVANCTFQIIVNMCCLKVHKGYHEDFWLQITHGLFGIGALIGPIIVRMFGLYGITIIGVGTVVGLPGYLYLATPEKRGEKQNQLAEQFSPTEKKSLPITKWSYVMLASLFFIYYGEQIGLAGWISSYAVILNIDDKQGATRYPLIFWISITAARFLLAGMQGKVSQKFVLLIRCQILCLVISLLFVWLGLVGFAVYWNSLLIGLCFSSMYAFLYTLPLDFGQQIDPKQTAFLIMIGAIGEGSVSTLIGMVMKYISVHGLFVSLLVFGVLKLIVVRMLVFRMKNEQFVNFQNYFEMKEISKPQ